MASEIIKISSTICDGCGHRPPFTCHHPPFYWLHDEVWKDVGGIRCPPCAEAALGRPLTLRDLSVRKFQETAEGPGGVKFVWIYVRAIVIGAIMGSPLRVPKPMGWPLGVKGTVAEEGLCVGEYLGRQTPDLAELLPTLIAEVNAEFPPPMPENEQ